MNKLVLKDKGKYYCLYIKDKIYYLQIIEGDQSFNKKIPTEKVFETLNEIEKETNKNFKILNDKQRC